MWIWISMVDDAEEPESPRSIISSYAAITNTNEMDWVGSSLQLERIKKTGTILFPFVQPGRNYYVSVDVYNLSERKMFINRDENLQHSWANAEVVAENGILFNRDDSRLQLNNDNSEVTLSWQSVFSAEVTFAPQRYSFGVTIQVEGGSVSVGDHHIPAGLSYDGLTWVFEPQMSKVNLRGGEWLEEGVIYPAWAEAKVNIIHDEIMWSVGIVKTPEFAFSL
jgi:hypothetical protein